MKKVISSILACLLVLTMLPAFGFTAFADDRSVSTDKDEYTEGEEIVVSAEVTNDKDWVAIYKADDVIGSTANGGIPSIYYWYPKTTGATIKLKESASAGTIYTANLNLRSDWDIVKSLPAGSYKVVLLNNDGYDVVAQQNITIKAEDGERSISTDKTTYQAGESIYVTAVGSGQDWVGIYAADDATDGSVNSIYWYTIGDNSGKAVNIKDTDVTTYNNTRSQYADLPEGNYKLVLYAGGNYDVSKTLNITISGTLVIDYSLSLDKAEYHEGDSIMITVSGASSSWAAVYKADDVIGAAADGGVPSLYWDYLKYHTSGEAWDIVAAASAKDGYHGSADPSSSNYRADWETVSSLPAGNYKAVLFTDGGYTVAKQIDFTITAHDYKLTVVNAPTCTENGTGVYECSICHNRKATDINDLPEELKATGHVWNDGEVTTPATCTTDGIKTYTCTKCGETKTEAIPASNHDYTKTSVTKATFSKDGATYKVCAKGDSKVKTATIKKIKSVTLSTSKYTYTGKAKKPSVKVKDSAGKTISSKYYTVSYAKGRKNVGKYSVKVTFKGNYSGSKTLNFTVVPKSTSISKLSRGKKSFKITWKKQTAQTTGYQIQYSTNKNMKSAKALTVKGAKSTSKTVKKLKAKKTYYVRVRTYKTVKGKNYFSSWSKVKSVKTK